LKKVGQRPAFFVAPDGTIAVGESGQMLTISTVAVTRNGGAPSMDKAAEIEALIAPTVEAMGYRTVRVLLAGGRHRASLQVMVEPADGRPLGLEDCRSISRALSALLDVEDPIAGAYTLEVSSPGIDRPLTRADDYVRFAGHEARLETRAPVDGRRRFRGRLVGLESDRVRIATPEGEAVVPLAEILRAKLVLTDDLIAAGRSRRDTRSGR
jgi:ribosome maturation factor RimP